jgi:hypothetical protein
MALEGTGLEPSIVSLSADEVAHVASRNLPALVTLRAGPTQQHMVVLFGRRPGGMLRVFDPAGVVEIDGMMDPETFRRRYTGSAIVLLPTDAPRRTTATLGAH